jgi:hypothetical protein
MNTSTDKSIGLIINGMHAKPINVVIHFLVGAGMLDCFFNTKLHRKQVLFIVKPGIITDASPCHINVSITAHFTFVFFFSSVCQGTCNLVKRSGK